MFSLQDSNYSGTYIIIFIWVSKVYFNSIIGANFFIIIIIFAVNDFEIMIIFFWI